MRTCKEISKNIKKNCDAPIVAGIEQVLYLIPRQYIKVVTRDQTNPSIIRDIELEAVKKGFKYEGFNKSIKPKWTGKKKEYSYGFKHEIDLALLDYSSEVKAELSALAGGEYVAIIQNKMKSNDAAIEVYGLDSGLKLKDGALRDLNDAASEGAIVLGLESEDGSEEPNPPASFAVLSEGADPKYDYAATIAALTALITA